MEFKNPGLGSKSKIPGRIRSPRPAFRLIFFGSLSVVCSLLLVVSPAYACPLCKEAISKMGEIWTSIGFNFSIYLMLAMPFLLVSAFAGFLYFNYRKLHKG